MTSTVFIVPRLVAKQTQEHLRRYGAEGNEGVVLWIGTPDPPIITEALIPEQIVGPGRFIVPRPERQRISRELAGSGRLVVSLVHSHEFAAFHSWIDDDKAFPRRTGAFSLVVPQFGRLPNLLDDAALFQLDAHGSWRPTLLETFQIAPGSIAETGKPRRFRWLTATLKSLGRSRT